MSRLLDEQPSGVDPLYAVWFDTEEWADAKQKFQQVVDLEGYLVERHQLKFPAVFNKFYGDTKNEVGFFRELAESLCDCGFYVYDSDNYFEVYDAEQIDKTYTIAELEDMGVSWTYFKVQIRPEIYRTALVKAHDAKDARDKAYSMSVTQFSQVENITGSEGFSIMSVTEAK